MQIIVLGAGAIGSVFGAKLAAHNDVTLIGRADHVRAINTNGLRIEGLEPGTIHLRAATRVEDLRENALILLTTKVLATAEALGPLASLLRDDTTVVSLQNGLDAERIAATALHGRGVVLRGITQAGAIFERAGTIRYMVRGQTLIESHERSATIAAVLNAAGLDCRISPDIVADVWRKLIYNCVVNPITAMLGCEVGGIADPRLARLKRLVVDECVAVAAAEGIVFAEDLLAEIDTIFATSRNIASMQQDLLRGRATEIDYMNGAVAALGAEQGIPCPINSGLTNIIKAMEDSAGSLLPEKVLEPQPV